MSRRPRYPIYVPTKGRWAHENALTIRTLRRDGVDFYAVVRADEADRYEQTVGDPTRLLQLPTSVSNLMETRCWIRDHAEAAGAAWHWQLDDNIRGVRRLYQGRRIPCNAGPALAAVEDFCARYENVGIGGLNYQMFGTPGSPPYRVNVHVYSCTLVNHAMPARWRLVYNDDTDLCLQALTTGWATLQVNVFLANKIWTMLHPGGNTDDLYQGDGRMMMARALERQWPGIATVGRKYGRVQHSVDWGRFRDEPALRLRSDVDLAALPPVDEYGLELQAVRPVKSPALRDLLSGWHLDASATPARSWPNDAELRARDAVLRAQRYAELAAADDADPFDLLNASAS